MPQNGSDNEAPTKEKEAHQNDSLPARSLKQKLVTIKKAVTVEPVVGFYYMAVYLCKPALANLEIEKACRVNLQYNDSICDTIVEGQHKNYSAFNHEIQVTISEMHSWQQPVQSFMPLILILFLGSYSDRHKWRKPFIILPIVGEVLGTVGCLLCVFNMKTWSLEVQGVLQKVIPSLFGGQTMLNMATTAYIADISSIEMRTIRLGILQIVISVAGPLVNSFCGILYSKIGYIPILSISSFLFLIALTFSQFWIVEKTSSGNKQAVSVIADIFSPKHAIDTFQVIFKKSPDVNQMHILLMILVTFLQRSAYDGETNLLYLYVQNVFQWTPVEFSFFITVNGLVLLIGNSLALPLFTKILRISDHMILFVCILTKIFSNVAFGLATTSLTFYIGSSVSVITRMYRVAKKSLSTKIVAEKDIGKFQSVIGICEAIAPALAVPVYNSIYIQTLDTFPAAVFFFSILLYAVCSVLVLLMTCLVKRGCEEKGMGVTMNKKSDYDDNIIETVHL
nr:uncharacterized protein LOC111502375 isoform X1 [Leptinotarsa decemlineata]XP_023012215.1 uncharacterized protein LOC111502375 isoform X1 [Leptinotarsa decemlineata]